MKKILTLALSAALLFSATVSYAGELNASGEISFVGQVEKTDNFQPFNVYQRVLMNFEYVNENVSGFVQLKAGGVQSGVDGVFGNGFDKISVRQAYVDFMVPTVDVKARIGLQAFATPSYVFGGYVDDFMTGVVLNKDFNDLSVTAGWLRNKPHYYGQKVKQDSVYLGATYSKDFVNAFAWGLYSNEKNLNDLYFVSAGTKLNFAPWTLSTEALYGKDNHTSGWMADFELDLALQHFTPYIAAWYATGDDGTTKHNLPSYEDSSFRATSSYFGGSYFWKQCDGFVSTPSGTMGVKAGLKDFHIVPALNTSVSVAFVNGTNDVDSAYGDWNYMTQDDKFVEFDFLTTYNVYESLTVGVEAAYKLNRWDNESVDNGYKVACGIEYKF